MDGEVDETNAELADFQSMQVDGESPIITESLVHHEDETASPREHQHQRSLKSMPELVPELREFCTSIELLVCFGSVVAGELLPRLFRTYILDRDGRPIPYQETAAGDVLIQLDLNNEVVDRESFPYSWLLVTCVAMPLIVLSVLGLWMGPRRDGLSIACSFLLSMGATALLTNMVKFYCGYFRPNFYHLCDWDAGNPQECNDERGLGSGRRSFPSGHSATSFCGMTMVSLWLLGNVQFRRRHFSYARRRFRYMAASIPMLFAFFIASSRVHDSYHHPADVATGALIGFGCASWAYGMWYPSIHDACSGVPLETLEEEEEAARHHQHHLPLSPPGPLV